MTDTQEVTAEALYNGFWARNAVDVPALADQADAIRTMWTNIASDANDQCSAKIAELTRDLEEALAKDALHKGEAEHWINQAADTVVSNNRLLERARAAEADNARLREALDRLDRDARFIVAGRPVRNYDETLAESASAIAASLGARAALLGKV